jgi:hypothetical protein
VWRTDGVVDTGRISTSVAFAVGAGIYLRWSDWRFAAAAHMSRASTQSPRAIG